MPHTHHTGFFVCIRYYWIEQIDLEYSQYYGLLKRRKKLKFWLNDKKKLFDSIMEYVGQRELREFTESQKTLYYWFYPYYPFSHPLHICRDSFLLFISPKSTPQIIPPPPYPPLSRFFLKDTLQLIQYHIQRLKNETHQSTFNAKARLDSANNYLDKTKKKKNKRERELNNKFNMQVKGKNFENKFAYKYG